LEKTHQRRDALASSRKPGHIQVVGATLLEGEPDKFSAPLNGRPVVQLIAHAVAFGSSRHLSLVTRHFVTCHSSPLSGTGPGCLVQSGCADWRCKGSATTASPFRHRRAAP